MASGGNTMQSKADLHLLSQTERLRALHTVIRDRDASPRDFTTNSQHIIRMLLERALDLLPYRSRDVITPVGETYPGLQLVRGLCGVSIVRAGESMEAALRDLHPGVPIGKILIQRDKQTKLPSLYFQALPGDIAERDVLLLEPMLATGGSLLKALDVLRGAGAGPESIVVVNFLASPQGLERVGVAYPGLRIVTSSVEQRLNEAAYMVPGIGDFGDRYFGTVPGVTR
jgi:uracil phosphoribosyltransferase